MWLSVVDTQPSPPTHDNRPPTPQPRVCFVERCSSPLPFPVSFRAKRRIPNPSSPLPSGEDLRRGTLFSERFLRSRFKILPLFRKLQKVTLLQIMDTQPSPPTHDNRPPAPQPRVCLVKRCSSPLPSGEDLS